MNASALTSGTDPDRPSAAGTTVAAAADAGVAFLRAQEQWLLRGLDWLGNPLETDVVLTAVAAAHAEWLALIAATGTLGPQVPSLLAELYAYHGRIAGSLERNVAVPLPLPAARALRQLTKHRLVELTDAAVVAISAPR